VTPTTNDGGGDSDPLGPRGGDPGDAEDRPETAEQPESESEAATEDGDGEPGADGPPAGGGSPGGSSTWGKRIAIGLLVVLLTVSVAGAHTLLVAQSTALSADYVTETMDEESVYADLEANATGTIVEAVAGDGAGPTAVPRWEEVVGSSVEELLGANYLRGQITDNVDSAYDFLHGREASLQLAVDTRPLLENVSGVVTRRVAEIPLPELVRAAPVSIPETAGIEITTDRIARAMESESAYRAVRADVRDQVGDVLLDSCLAFVCVHLITSNCWFFGRRFLLGPFGYLSHLEFGRFGFSLEEFDDAVDDRFGVRRTSRDVHVDRHDLVDTAQAIVVVVEDPSRARAGADRDHELRFGHLFVDPFQAGLHLTGYRPRTQQHVGVSWRALLLDTEPFDVVAGHQGVDDLDVTPVTAPAVHVQDPRRLLAGPVDEFRHVQVPPFDGDVRVVVMV